MKPSIIVHGGAWDADGRWRGRGTILEVSDRHRFERALRRERDRAEAASHAEPACPPGP